jgi:hypothetical protein
VEIGIVKPEPVLIGCPKGESQGIDDSTLAGIVFTNQSRKPRANWDNNSFGIAPETAEILDRDFG